MSLRDELEQEIRYRMSELPAVQQAFIEDAPVDVSPMQVFENIALQLNVLRHVVIPRLADEIDALKEATGEAESDD
jgi:hypothetical protein